MGGMSEQMKIAIMYDYIGCAGGAEKLFLTLARELDADVITTELDIEVLQDMGFEDVRIIPMCKTVLPSPLKQIRASLLFRFKDFSKDYDFFILGGNFTHYAARKHRPNLWYCNTPFRAFYNLRDFTIRSQGTALHRNAARLWIWVHRHFDKRAVGNVEKIIANSKNVQKRIERYYGRESKVIYPSVPTKEFRYKKNGGFWLSVTRLYPEKRVELQIEVFRRLPDLKLKIVGGYTKGSRTRKIDEVLSKLPKNVEFVGGVSEHELRQLYAECTAFITTSMEEDFGMTTVEAMASGKPVVAVREGGHTESVVDGVTGKLVRADVDELVAAVKEISRDPKRFREACEERAGQFDIAIFLGHMEREIGA